uniref:Keratin n=1 Tax=Malurus cyaneus samueli TaxID=2593467 RepID=A0A8C5TL32_9PASS
MLSKTECLPGCEVSCTQPCAYSRSLEPCVASCGDSRAVVFPPPVVLTFPGPTLSTCSQESVVGAAGLGDPLDVGVPSVLGARAECRIPSGPVGRGAPVLRGSFGSGGAFGYGGSSGMGGSCTAAGPTAAARVPPGELRLVLKSKQPGR